ncbi:hypothetical protein ABZW18_02815 [Streptomyces sp. NPDC004647]|uniref:hypothetical protein n=1 Tax=Streptomyces sp. NPDC004647 TaxID=3154671 RepID=UPI0033BC8908
MLTEAVDTTIAAVELVADVHHVATNLDFYAKVYAAKQIGKMKEGPGKQVAAGAASWILD